MQIIININKIQILVKNFFYKNFSLLFFILLYSSFIYKVPYLNWDSGSINNLKKIFYFIFFMCMLFSINYKSVKNVQFLWCCLLWAAAHVFSWFIHQINPNLYLTRVAQILFISVFVTFLLQYFQKIEFINFIKWFKPWFISFVALILLALPYIDNNNISYFKNGFGGNRVNLSIWLAQIVFLYLLFLPSIHKERNPKLNLANENLAQILKIFVLITPIIGLQVFLSGRIGLLVSAILCVIFLIKEFRLIRGVLLATLYLIITLVFFSSISPIRDENVNNFNIERGIFDNSKAINEIDKVIDLKLVDSISFGPQIISFLKWIDIVSSYRFSLMIAALDSYTSNVFFWGIGVGNFFLNHIGGNWQMHNIFLNHFGELGIAGLLPLIFIVLIPILQNTNSKLDKSMKLICLAWTFIALLQPELLVSQLGTSLIYWVAFAYLLRKC